MKLVPTEFVLSFQFQTNVSEKRLFRAPKLTFSKGKPWFGRKTCAFSFHCFQAKTWAAPKRLFRLVKPTFSVVYKRLFQPEKLTFSPVKRSVSFPKQTPGCIPTVEGVSSSKFTELEVGMELTIMKI